jgi:hypothetical protein
MTVRGRARVRGRESFLWQGRDGGVAARDRLYPSGAPPLSDMDTDTPTTRVPDSAGSLHSALLRIVNETIRELTASWYEAASFHCECGAPECSAIVELTHEEFDFVTATEGCFLVARDHIATGQTVVGCVRGIAALVGALPPDCEDVGAA